jgi:uncharacterized protein (DUF924 family)
MNTRTALIAVSLLTTAAFGQSVNHDKQTMLPTTAERSKLTTNPEALRVFDFWKEAGPGLWFAKDADFDRRFRERFLLDHEAAARGELNHWQSTPEGAFALVILLDQFPRNAFRGSVRMYDTDALARRAAITAFAAGYDQQLPMDLRKFLVLPFAHSEDLADQERSVALARRMLPDDLAHAMQHRDIVRRFGRFPHRNVILSRESTADEIDYLAHGGYQG